MSKLNDDQRRVVECHTHCLVVACPGAGKTSTIVAKIDAILDQAPTNQVCAVTFTRDAASELNERIRRVRADADKRVYYGTFHSLCRRQLKRAGRNLQIVKTGDQRRFIFIAMRQAGMDDYETALAEIDSIKGSLEYADGTHKRTKLFDVYQELLERNHLVDFHDLMAEALRGLRDGTVQPVPCTHMLVDEFQDTDAVQYAWVLEHVKRGVIVTVVGDDDQCIYAFRAALGFAGMDRFRADTGAELFTLAINYRSNFEILDAAARVIQNNPNRFPKLMQSNNGEGGTVNRVAIFAAEGKSEDGLRKKLLKRQVETEYVIGEIMRHVVPAQSDDAYRYTAKTGSLAILGRTRFALDPIEQALADYGVRYYRNTASVWDSDPAAGFLSMLETVERQSPAGIEAAFHFAGVDHEDVSALHKQLQKRLMSHMTGSEPIAVDGISDGGLLSINSLRESICRWRTQLEARRYSLVVGGVADWIIQHLRASPDYVDPTRDENGRGSKAYHQAEQIHRLRGTFQGKLKGSLSERIFQLRSLGKSEPEDEWRGVALYTMHGCKGLEFDQVWIVQAEQKTIPGNSLDKALGTDGTSAVIEDERRLFYVAMTRARKILTMTYLSTDESQYVAETGLPISEFALTS